MKLQKNTCSIPAVVRNDITTRAGDGIKTAQHISTGCYADIFLLTFETAGQCILKQFRFPGIAERELTSYRILKSHGALPMPMIFFSNPSLRYICMEHLDGQPLSRVSAPNPALASKVVDLLINCHRHCTDDTPEQAAMRWETMYRMRQRDILERSLTLAHSGQLEMEVYDQFRLSVSALPQILGKSVQQLSLIHGDFTPWNIMVDHEARKVTAVLDPYLADFGDREYDLMMMNKANGRSLDLVSLYQQEIPPSAQFERKTVYYNAWNELCHYYFSDRKQSMNIAERAYELKQVICA